MVLTALVFAQISSGLGHHIIELPQGYLTLLLQFFYASIPFYYLSLSLTKFSILSQTIRILAVGNKPALITGYVFTALTVLYALYTIFTSFALCQPAAFFWDKSIKGGKCLNMLALWFTNAAINIFTDLGILALPIAVVMTLSLPKPQKIFLYIVFGIGGVVCIISILRLHSLYIISVSKDPSFDNLDAAMWSTLEVQIAILCACLPCLRPLASRWFPQIVPPSLTLSEGSRAQRNGRESGSSSKGLVREVATWRIAGQKSRWRKVDDLETGRGLSTYNKPRHLSNYTARNKITKTNIKLDIDKPLPARPAPSMVSGLRLNPPSRAGSLRTVPKFANLASPRILGNLASPRTPRTPRMEWRLQSPGIVSKFGSPRMEWRVVSPGVW